MRIIYIDTMKIQQIYQFDYPEESIDPTTNKKGTCVLSVLQMALESIVGESLTLREFYLGLLKAGIIRKDAYVNSYERAFEWYRKQIRFYKRNPTDLKGKWVFSVDKMDMISQIEQENPVFLFLGGHCVLAEAYNHAEDMVYVVDPYFKGAAARYKLLRPIKKIGFFI